MSEPEATLSRNHIARVILVAFVLTFIASRVMVILIMTRRVPDMFFHLGGTHIHHLNYGIFLLSAIGAYLLLMNPSEPARRRVAFVYGIGLALTFDEFGMWLHLGGSYWQRASFDAVVIIAALFALIAVAPRIRNFNHGHWIAVGVIAVAILLFGGLLVDSVKRYADRRLAPYFRSIEESGPQ